MGSLLGFMDLGFSGFVVLGLGLRDVEVRVFKFFWPTSFPRHVGVFALSIVVLGVWCGCTTVSFACPAPRSEPYCGSVSLCRVYDVSVATPGWKYDQTQ